MIWRRQSLKKTPNKQKDPIKHYIVVQHIKLQIMQHLHFFCNLSLSALNLKSHQHNLLSFKERKLVPSDDLWSLEDICLVVAILATIQISQTNWVIHSTELWQVITQILLRVLITLCCGFQESACLIRWQEWFLESGFYIKTNTWTEQRKMLFIILNTIPFPKVTRSILQLGTCYCDRWCY